MEENKIAGHKVVIAGGSAGSLNVLLDILPKLREPLPYAFVIVVHRKSGEDSTLEELIAMKTSVPLGDVEDKVPLLPGHIYIAPADYHILFEKEYEIALDTSEKVNYSRPSIDVAFESAAEAFGPLLTGILLSGSNADGTNGVKAIKDSGGIVLIQKPETADMPYMPQHAAAAIRPDHILDAPGLLKFLNEHL